MRVSRSVLGLALLSAIIGCAILTQTASAAFTLNKKTTFVTCVPGEGNLSNRDYSDAHCDKKVTSPTGSFSHSSISGETEIIISNEKTESETMKAAPTKFNVTLGGVPAELTATTVSGTGTIKNAEPAAGEMTATGTATVEYTGITVNKPTGCKVTEPVKVNAKLSAVSEGENMGIVFEPAVAGANFTEFTFENKGTETCSLKGQTVKVKGSAISTGGSGKTASGSGATSIFESGNGMESLKVGEATATFSSITTTRMKKVGTTEGNPIATTTFP